MTANTPEPEPISHLVALSPEHSTVIVSLVRGGWDDPGSAPSMKVLNDVSSSNGVAFWPVGAFDDVEAGAIALGIPPVIDWILA